MTLGAAALSAQAFAPFGEVISVEGHAGILVNQGRGQRFDTGAHIAHSTSANEPTLALYHMQPSRLPVSLDLLERHPHSAQMFLPMGARRYLVVVAPALAGGAPDAAEVRAFVARGDQGVIYAPGIWHAPLAALDEVSTFAMIMFENGDAEDCVLHQLQTPFHVAL